MSNSESNKENNNFGAVLAEARKAKNYSVDDICENIKIPKHVILAIEADDVAVLPAPTFTRGYIRAYAKFLEIAEESLLAMYNQTVPHDKTSTLKPRSGLPGEASSQSPLIKTVTILLIVGGIAALLYGSFQYYQQKADVMEGELESKERSFTGNSLDSPGSNRLNIEQNVDSPESEELTVENSDSIESVAGQEPVLRVEPEKITVKSVDEVVVEDNQEMSQDDVIEIFAEKGSWIEVRDVSQARLLYNMIPSGESKVLKGKAPFRISMGNANSTRVIINDIEIDVTGYIRSNNTASFTVSNEGENIIFH